MSFSTTPHCSISNLKKNNNSGTFTKYLIFKAKIKNVLVMASEKGKLTFCKYDWTIGIVLMFLNLHKSNMSEHIMTINVVCS